MPNSAPSARTTRDRYMAFAFSWGDVLLEVDADGCICFAEGACDVLFGRPGPALTGASLSSLCADAAESDLVLEALRRDGRAEAELRLRRPGGRPIAMHLAGYCHDPCGTTYLALRLSRNPPAPAPVTRDPDAFARHASAVAVDWGRAGDEAAVSFVAAPRLGALKEGLAPEAAARLDARLETAVAAHAVGPVLKIDEGSYGLVHQAAADLAGLVAEIGEIARTFDPAGLDAEAVTLAGCDPQVISEEDVADGVLYAISRFRESQADGVTLKDLSKRMLTLAGEAVNEVRRFKEMCREGSFEIVFQPIVDLHSGQVQHFEALSRFPDAQDSVQGVIAFAESTGMICDFDLAVARQALKALDAFPRNSDRLRLAINVSGASISRPEYTRSLLQLLEPNLWSRGKLMFEITESARMDDLAAAASFIDALRRWGYQVCLDDFGAGAASFRYLSMLHVDIVKIDGWSIRNARRSNKGAAFLEALTGLCRRLAIRTVGEMVDSPEMLNFVRECGFDYAQGYLFGKPHRDIAHFSPLPNAALLRAKPALAAQPLAAW